MTKVNRFIAVIMAFAVVFVMLFSVCFIIAEAHHDCIGDDCEICYQISICENTLRFTGFSVIAVIVGFLWTFSILLLPYLSKKSNDNITLVSLKVKLSD